MEKGPSVSSWVGRTQAIMAYHTFFHWGPESSMNSFLDQCAQVLAPGGRVYCTVWDEEALKTLQQSAWVGNSSCLLWKPREGREWAEGEQVKWLWEGTVYPSHRLTFSIPSHPQFVEIGPPRGQTMMEWMESRPIESSSSYKTQGRRAYSLFSPNEWMVTRMMRMVCLEKKE